MKAHRSLQVGQQCREVLGLFEHGPAGLAQVHAQFGRDDVAERGLAQAGRAEQQHMVERLAALLCGADEDLKLLARLGLTHVFLQQLGAQGALNGFFPAMPERRKCAWRARGKSSVWISPAHYSACARRQPTLKFHASTADMANNHENFTLPHPVRSPSFTVCCLWSGPVGRYRARQRPRARKAVRKVEFNKKKLIGAGTADVNTTSAANPKEVGSQVREALGTNVAPNKKLTVVVSDKSAGGHAPAPSHSPAPVATQSSRAYIQARAAALTGHAAAPAGPDNGHGGEVHCLRRQNGPQTWGKLKPEFNLCV